MATLYIPKKLLVGFQERRDTFTGKLAYVIYYDEKNKLRKETSWRGWCKEELGTMEVENEPMNGFIFNKGIQRSSEWFGSGRSVFRVYAPHDFEFEINSDNLINILMHSDVTKREILEQCVFAWAGTELVLLPTNSVEYQEAVEHTAKQTLKVSAKELVKGVQYHKKKTNTIVTYIGFFDWWEFGYTQKSWRNRPKCDFYAQRNQGKKHIFKEGDNFVTYGASVLSSAVSNEPVENYAELVDEYFHTHHSQEIIDITTIPDVELKATIRPEGEYFSFPDMYKISEQDGVKIIHSIGVTPGRGYYLCYYDNDPNQKNFHANAKFTEVSRKFRRNPNYRLEVIQYPRTDSYGYYAHSGYLYNSREVNLHDTLQPLALKQGYDYEKLTVQQYVELMKELGYGEAKLILQNGNLTNFKCAYYY